MGHSFPGLVLLFIALGAQTGAVDVGITWDAIPDAQYCLHVYLKPGRGVQTAQGYAEQVENFADATVIGTQCAYRFDGASPSRDDIPAIPLEHVAAFAVDAAGEGKWHERAVRHAAMKAYDGTSTVHLYFPVILRWNKAFAGPPPVTLLRTSGERAGLSPPLGRFYTVFAGRAPRIETVIPRADIAAFEVGGLHGEAVLRVPFSGKESEIFFDFPDSETHGLRNRLVCEALADPGVLDEGDPLLLTGTNERDTTVIPLYAATGFGDDPMGAAFSLLLTYRPNVPGSPAYDPNYMYCHLWGPELIRQNGCYTLYFSALRVPRTPEQAELPCPAADDRVTVFQATAGADLEFGPPRPYAPPSPGAPRHTLDYAVPATSGSPDKMKLDVVVDQDAVPQRVYYTWFRQGNHIASFALDPLAPDIRCHVDPLFPDEERIVEAPAILHRRDCIYLFYSAGFFNSRYRMAYLRGHSAERLRREPGEHPPELTEVIAYEEKILRNAGHCAVTEKNRRYYIFYHVGHFRDGVYWPPRDTYMAPLRFRPDGSVISLPYW